MTRPERTMRWVLAISALLAGRAAADGRLYVRQPTLAETMLATRARLEGWQTAQQQALRAVKIGGWSQCAEKIDPATCQPDKRWRRLAADAAGSPRIPRSTSGYLAATLTAAAPTRITIELSRHETFGGYAYRPPANGAGVRPTDALVWLNGRAVSLADKLQGYAEVPVAQRRGWHDALLVDLDLGQGENRLLVSLDKGKRAAWFNAVRFASQPADALWAMIEHDFPRSANPLLEAVDAAWFDSSEGWFCEGASPRHEQQFLDQVRAELGAEAARIGRRREELIRQKADAFDARWLELCVSAAELQAGLREADALTRAVEALSAAYGDRYPGKSLAARIAALRGRILEGAAGARTELGDVRQEALLRRNPLLAERKLLLVKRDTYDSNHYYDEFIVGIRRFAGGLFLVNLADGSEQEIAPELRGGIFDRYDLSFDGHRVVFNYKPARPGGFRLYEIGVDGRGLRQITRAPVDEPQRIARYATCSWSDLEKDPTRYGHWTDDMHPCYLPDGGIAFTSTRPEQSVLCGGHELTVTNLHRVESDGSRLRRLSQGALSEFCPTVMNDGRILYNRWEYVDKGAGAVQALWAMHPDGGRPEEVYGDAITTPAVFNQARQVPDRNNLLVCLGCAHCPGNMGAILTVDLHKNKRYEGAMTALTPGCVPEGNWGLRQRRNGRWMTDIYGPWYSDPFPLSDATQRELAGKFYLVSCNPEGMWNDPAGYGICLLDVFGNRVPVYADSETSCWQARPLEPRARGPVLAGVCAEGGAPAGDQATLVVADVARGLDGVAPGAVKYLRVMEQVARPWSAWLGYEPNDRAPGQMVAVSLYTHLSIKVLHGVVPVQPDGSASFTVPAGRNLFLQALDENFMEIQRMRTFVNLRPGERRSCVGCHEHRNQAPVGRPLAALARAPATLQAQPGESAPRPIHYTTDIQPIFDRHCAACHSGAKRDGELDLGGEMTELFCRSYEEIIRKDLVGYIQEFVGPKPEGAQAMGYAASVAPYTYGSHKAKLVSVLRAGHYGVKLPRADFVRLVTWVDANAPYYGSYFGRRNIAHRERADFRPVPTLESALGLLGPE